MKISDSMVDPGEPKSLCAHPTFQCSQPPLSTNSYYYSLLPSQTSHYSTVCKYIHLETESSKPTIEDPNEACYSAALILLVNFSLPIIFDYASVISNTPNIFQLSDLGDMFFNYMYGLKLLSLLCFLPNGKTASMHLSGFHKVFFLVGGKELLNSGILLVGTLYWHVLYSALYSNIATWGFMACACTHWNCAHTGWKFS